MIMVNGEVVGMCLSFGVILEIPRKTLLKKIKIKMFSKI